MPNLTKSLSGFFTYKEQQNKEHGFELLENEDKKGLNNTDSIPNSGKQDVIDDADNANQPDEVISTDLNINIQNIKQKFSLPKNQDIVIRNLKIGRKLSACLVFVEGMIDKQLINISLLPRLMSEDILCDMKKKENAVDFLMENVIAVHDICKKTKYSDIIKQVLNGVTALLVEGCNECILIETRGYEKRAVESPKTETVIKGSQEAFTENLRTNVTMVRRIVKNEHLVTEMLSVGKTNGANCAVLYLEGVANPEIVSELMKRINAVDADFILSEGMLEQFIEDDSFMMLPQVLSTERPDRTASFLINGQVVMITDGTPFAMAVPVNFFQLFHTSEETNVRWMYGAFLRAIRLFGFFCAMFLPGLYCAVVLFHPEMIPTELLSSITRARESVPFPTVLEILIMEFSFELIREAGIRVASIIGQTLGIVGALILGQTAVAAGLVSPLLVIVVAITALGSFSIPNYSLAIATRIIRFIFILTGSAFGFYGVSLVLFLLVCVACGMKSFGVPYLAPVAPKINSDGGIALKKPIWISKNRPDEMNTNNTKKQGNNQSAWVNSPNQKEQ